MGTRSLRGSVALLLRRNAEGRNITWLSAERVLQMLTGLVIGAAVARHLGAQDYGRLAYALAFVTLLTPLLAAGDGLVVRDLGTGRTPSEAVLGNAALLTVVLGTVGAAVIATSTLLFGSDSPMGTAPLVAVLMLGWLGKPLAVVDYWFQAKLEARRAVLARNLSFIICVAIRVVAIAMDAPVAAFAAIVATESLLSSVFLYVTFRRQGGRLSSWRLDREHLVALARQAVPQVLAGLSVIIYMRIDQVMLGSLSGLKESGLYAIAVLLAEVTWFLPMAVAASLMPSMTRLWEQDRAGYERRLQSLFTAAAAVSYLVVALSVGIGVWFIPLAYGASFRAAVPAFVILTLATPFVYLGVMQSLRTTHAKEQVLSLWRTLLAAAVNVGANILVLPRWGATGAAVTTVLAQFVAVVAGNAIFPRTRVIAGMQWAALRLRGVRDLVQSLQTLA